MKILTRTIKLESLDGLIILAIDSFMLEHNVINMADILHPQTNRPVVGEGEYKLHLGPTRTIETEDSE